LDINEYLVEIKQFNGTFTPQMSYCDASQPSIRDPTICTIPLTVLYAAPYSLPLKSLIEVRVTAKNNYGDSITSEVGGNAIIQYVPDAPVSLSTNTTLTSASQIGIYWSDGSSNGEATVTTYNVYYKKQGSPTWILLSSTVAVKSYLVKQPQVTLIQGDWYDFKV